MMRCPCARQLQPLVRPHVNDHAGYSLSLRRAPDLSNCRFDSPGSRFGLLGALNSLDVFTLTRVGEATPTLQSLGCGFEGFYEVSRWRNFALVSIEIQTNVNRLASLQPRGFTIGPAQWNARGTTHRSDRAPICVAVERNFDRYAYVSEYGLGIEREWYEATRTFSNDLGSEGFRSHLPLSLVRPNDLALSCRRPSATA